MTLNKTHLSTVQGQNLVKILLYIGQDGEISDHEIRKLHEWLKAAPQDIPAVRHILELIGDALRDGFICEEERKIIHKQLERVLPPTERERLTMARKAREAEKKKEEKVTRERAREEQRERDRQEWNKPSEAQIRYIKNLGGILPEGATRGEASILIDRLLHSGASITPRQRMILKFWNITPNPEWGKADVSEWMDVWYEGDPDRQTAWEIFKDENRGIDSANDPALVPIGAGKDYLKRVKSGEVRKNVGYIKPVILLGAALCIVVLFMEPRIYKILGAIALLYFLSKLKAKKILFFLLFLLVFLATSEKRLLDVDSFLSCHI